MNICWQVFRWTYVLISLSKKYLGLELLRRNICILKEDSSGAINAYSKGMNEF